VVKAWQAKHDRLGLILSWVYQRLKK